MTDPLAELRQVPDEHRDVVQTVAIRIATWAAAGPHSRVSLMWTDIDLDWQVFGVSTAVQFYEQGLLAVAPPGQRPRLTAF